MKKYIAIKDSCFELKIPKILSESILNTTDAILTSSDSPAKRLKVGQALYEGGIKEVCSTEVGIGEHIIKVVEIDKDEMWYIDLDEEMMCSPESVIICEVDSETNCIIKKRKE